MCHSSPCAQALLVAQWRSVCPHRRGWSRWGRRAGAKSCSSRGFIFDVTADPEPRIFKRTCVWQSEISALCRIASLFFSFFWLYPLGLLAAAASRGKEKHTHVWREPPARFYTSVMQEIRGSCWYCHCCSTSAPRSAPAARARAHTHTRGARARPSQQQTSICTLPTNRRLLSFSFCTKAGVGYISVHPHHRWNKQNYVQTLLWSINTNVNSAMQSSRC